MRPALQHLLVFARGSAPGAGASRSCPYLRPERVIHEPVALPAQRTCSRADCPSQDLIKVHNSFLRAIDVSMMAGGSTLAKVFLDFKER